MVIAALAGCGSAEDGLSSDDLPGPYSAVTAKELSELATGAPLLLPAELPAGLDPDVDEVEPFEVQGRAAKDGDQPFFLHNVTGSLDGKDPDSEVITYYSALILDGVGRQRYVVMQRSAELPPPACLAGGEQYLDRLVGEYRVRVCAHDLAEGSAARKYWAGVDFAGEVDWLRS